jgi:hypothetical protein
MQVTGLLEYPHLTYPYPRIVDPEQRRYSAALIPPIRALFGIEAAINRVALAAWGPRVEFSSVLRFREVVRGGRWCIVATNPDLPICRDSTGMPERPDMFYAGQTVEMDLVFFAFEHMNICRDVNRGVQALLKGIKFIGGFARSTD